MVGQDGIVGLREPTTVGTCHTQSIGLSNSLSCRQNISSSENFKIEFIIQNTNIKGKQLWYLMLKS